MSENVIYEVETRVYFDSKEEAFEKLPFLKDSLSRENDWITHSYGSELFKDGCLLRLSEVFKNGCTKYYLGFKEKDLGGFCNIRIEEDEEITDGLKESLIIKRLGKGDFSVDPKNIEALLTSLGHENFMTFSGNNQTGVNEEYGVALKLMYCETLQYPLMVEIEKSAATFEEALKAEAEIKDIIIQFKLQDRVIRKEPPTLLYEVLFKQP